MTDTATPCERCGRHPGDPTICHPCRLAAHDDLESIRRNHRTLADHLEPGGSGTPGPAVPGSRPPLRVDVLSLMSHGGLSGVLASWVLLLLDEGRLGSIPDHRLAPAAYTDACAARIAAHLDWLLDQPFAAELAAELADARRDVDTALGLTEPTWQRLPGRWTCPVQEPGADRCGGPLVQKVDEWLIRCPRCGERWDGELEVERLGRLLGCEFEVTVDQAAVLAGVHASTVYRWIDTRQLTAAMVDGRAWVDKRDLAIVLLRRQGA